MTTSASAPGATVNSPTQRTLAHLRSHGWVCAITEHWNAYAKIRQDLFGFGDIMAMVEGSPPMIVQTTSGANHASRVTKIRNQPLAKLWLSTGGRITVISWSKTGPRGKRKTWTSRTQEIYLRDFTSVLADEALP